MPQLVMTVSENKLTTSLGHPTHGKSDTKVQGFAVGLAKRASEPSQQWRFTGDGYIYAQVSCEHNKLLKFQLIFMWNFPDVHYKKEI